MEKGGAPKGMENLNNSSDLRALNKIPLVLTQTEMEKRAKSIYYELYDIFTRYVLV